MPFTPFHFGPGLALKAAAPARLSFMVFCYSQVVTDLEPGFHIIRGGYPLHRFFHTFLGATLVGIFCALSGRPICRFALRLGRDFLRNEGRSPPGQSADIPWRTAFVSALLGTYSHVILDGILHTDVRPFHPFTDVNPLLRIISPMALHEACVVLGAAGVFIFLTRMVRNEPPDQLHRD